MLAFANTSQQITHWDLVGHPDLMQQNRISDNFQYIYVDMVKAVLTQWLK